LARLCGQNFKQRSHNDAIPNKDRREQLHNYACRKQSFAGAIDPLLPVVL
jgi:hypothetical protein